MFFVYVLKSIQTGKYYKGLTKNLDRRIEEHNAGKTSSNKALRPFRLIYVQIFETLEQAREFEKFLKTGFGREIIKEIDDKLA